jgi:hypothetical protein
MQKLVRGDSGLPFSGPLAFWAVWIGLSLILAITNLGGQRLLGVLLMLAGIGGFFFLN